MKTFVFSARSSGNTLHGVRHSSHDFRSFEAQLFLRLLFRRRLTTAPLRPLSNLSIPNLSVLSAIFLSHSRSLLLRYIEKDENSKSVPLKGIRVFLRRSGFPFFRLYSPEFPLFCQIFRAFQPFDPASRLPSVSSFNRFEDYN